MTIPAAFSLLWPPEVTPPAERSLGSERWVRDLSLARTLEAFTTEHGNRQDIARVLLQLSTDAQVINFRLDVLDDLLAHPEFAQRLKELLPSIAALDFYRTAVDRERTVLQDVAWRLGELESFVECVSSLRAALDAAGESLQAAGWRRLKTLIAQVEEDENYRTMREALPEMVKQVRAKASVTIGVNLDERMRPVAATLLSVNAEPFKASSMLDRLLGRMGDEWTGLAPLHSVPDPKTMGVPERARREISPLMVPLFKDLANVLESISKPIATELRRYVNVSSGFLAGLRGELVWYLAAVGVISRLRAAGLLLVRPEIAPQSERVCTVEGAYNLNLALHMLRLYPERPLPSQIVPNDIQLDGDGRIIILTGPNQGGKTTYTQSIGLCQVLAQAGMYVPGSSARISPVDQIFTHYPVEEELEKETGRFGDEAQRLGQIFDRLTRHSLLLLNESFSSTSPGEALYLAQDIVRVLRILGARAVFGTHLHALAESVAELNESVEGESRVVSMVASRIEGEGKDGEEAENGRSFQVTLGPPLGRSYAREIAAQYGIDFDQLTSRLSERGQLPEGTQEANSQSTRGNHHGTKI